MAEKIRILIADDHPVVRDGLAAILSTQPDFEVIGEAGDGLQVVQMAISEHPDVVLLDLEMPHMDGVEALKQLRAKGTEAKTLVFTAFDTDERILGAIEAGAKGYLLKGAPRDELFKAIRVINEGGSTLEPVVASKLLRHLSQRPDRILDDPERLTVREKEVLSWIASGRTNREIAELLFISERTVKFHVSSILHKLGAANRTEAVNLATQRGWIEH
jgi:two-component system, NarL family, response regulator LiaR